MLFFFFFYKVFKILTSMKATCIYIAVVSHLTDSHYLSEICSQISCILKHISVRAAFCTKREKASCILGCVTGSQIFYITWLRN